MISKPQSSFTILSPQSGETVTLNPTTPLNPGLALTWAAMDYGSPTEVTYTVQVDKMEMILIHQSQLLLQQVLLQVFLLMY